MGTERGLLILGLMGVLLAAGGLGLRHRAPTPPPGWLGAACGLSGLAFLALYRRVHVADLGKAAKRWLRVALVCALALYAWAWWTYRYPFF